MGSHNLKIGEYGDYARARLTDRVSEHYFRNMSSDTRGNGDVQALRDARSMRALAHPVRLQVLEILRDEGALTATEMGERIGESPANTAFHLRTLAKYGFVEEAGPVKGRSRPWRSVPGALLVREEEIGRASC